MNKGIPVLALCALMATAVLAADLDGSWVVKMTGRDGQPTEQTYAFKVDGKKLTGSVTGPRGEAQIKDGSVDGAAFAFSVERPGRDGNMMTLQYKGKLEGDTITLSTEYNGQVREMKGERKK